MVVEEKGRGEGGEGREGGGRRKPNRSHVDVEEKRSERGGSGDRAWGASVG